MKNVLLLITFTLATLSYADLTNTTSQDEAMAKMMKLSTPGEHHAILKDLTGNWNYTSKFWMDKTSQPETSKGTSSSKLIMNGRFVQSTFKGKAMGKPFNGMGLLGYDNVREEYQSIWIDDMGTGIMNSTGSYDPATKTISEKGTASCPMTGDKNKSMRGEYKFIDKKNFTYSMYTNDKDGSEFKSMEIVYKKI